MVKLPKYIPQSEAELHLIIKSDLEAIEEGLVLLKHEYPSVNGFIDLLCVDSGNRLVIIEVKLHDDENVLFQALRYFSDTDKDRYIISSQFSNYSVDPDQSPRIIIIAETISEDIRRLSTVVIPDIELLEYTTVELPENDKGIIYHSVSPPIITRIPSEPKTYEQLINYVTNDQLKPVIDEMRQAILSLGVGIEEYATQSYIGYKQSSGRQFAFIQMYRKEVGFGAIVIDEDKQILDYVQTRVSSQDMDYSETLERIKTSFLNLGGILEENITT
ncbi:MAG: endonuclease NucS domain-containing protein [Anaerolineales bacterium]